jgi:iron complex outermembrane receptor protein
LTKEELVIRKEKTLGKIAAVAGILFVSQWNGSLSYGQSAPDTSGAGKETSAPSISASSVIYGTIFSSKDKKPLSAVPVSLKNNGTGQVVTKKTDMQGAFIFSHLAPGNYQIIAGGGSFSLQKKEGILKGNTVGEMNFQVLPLSTGNSVLSGNVYEGHGDNKIPLAAQMAVKNTRTNEIYTIGSDSSGHFSLNNIPSGDYLVQITKKGYFPVSENIAINGSTSHDFPLHLNRLAEANINAEADKKIQDNTGGMTIVGRKKFAENQTTGLGYVLMQTPSVNFYSRSGANGITGGMNFFMCRGYTTGGSNSAPSGGANIEFSVEGVPQNVNQDGGMVYDLNLMNNDISSVDIQRGVTTSQQLGNYASGCAINIHLVQPTKDAYSQITSGMGNYGLYYTSFITNTGLNTKVNAAGYNDLSLLNMNGFQEYTNYQEIQDYGNLSKYLSNGYVKLMFTGAYKNYDRASSMTLQDFNSFGASYNGLPNGENTSYANGVNTPNSPYYKNWISERYMFTLQSENKINDSVTIKNNAFALITPYGVINVPVTSTGTIPIPGGGTFQNLTPTYSGQQSSGGSTSQNPFNFSYIQGQGFKVGDIVESTIKLWNSLTPIIGQNTLHVGFRLSDSNYLYKNNPLLSPNITGNGQDASYEILTIGGYLEDHWRPTHQVLVSAGFRAMEVGEQYSEHLTGANLTFMSTPSVAPTPASPGGLAGGGGGGEGGITAGQNFDVFLPHVGIDYYPVKELKLYASAGQSYSTPSIQFWSGLAPGQQQLNVQPEIINDYQMGARYTGTKGFIAIDGYSDYISNMLLTSLVPINGILNVIPVQANTAQMEGIEAEFKYAIGDGFSVDGNYSATNATFLSASFGPYSNTGDRLPFVPSQMANLDLNYAAGPWHATINERYTGNMNVIDTSGGPSGNCNCQANSPGYFVTNLILAYDLPTTSWYKSAQLFFNAFNLLNTNYYNPAFLTNNNNVDTLFVYPGEPINVFGGVTVTF